MLSGFHRKTVAPKELGILILLLHRLPVVPTIRLPENCVEKQGAPQMAPRNGREGWEMAPGKLGNESSSKEARFNLKDHWTFLSVLDALTAPEIFRLLRNATHGKIEKKKKTRTPFHSLCFKTVP